MNRVKKRKKKLAKSHAKKLRRKAFEVCKRKLGTLENDYMEVARRIAFDLGREYKTISVKLMDQLFSEYSGIKIHEKLKFSKNGSKITKNFYETDEWRQLRIEVFNIHGYKCLKCGAEPPTELHIDHIKPRSLYPELELEIDNLQVLCKDCNIKKSNKHCADYREKTYDDYVEEQLDIELIYNSPL